MICIISFSGRKNGNCEQICENIAKYHGSEDVKIFKLSELNLHPCGQCAYECFRPDTACPYIDDAQYTIMDQITHSDLCYFVVPNYCGYPSANYFAFKERAVCYFGRDKERMGAYMATPKKFIAITNSSEERFAEAFSHQTNGKLQMLTLATSKYGKQSIAGDLMASEQARQDLMEFLRE